MLDADLTGRPVSSTSQTFPGAAFGYMDGEVRLGYQLAEICLHTALFGRQWLSAQHHPGNTVSAPCLLSLVQEAERRLGCHPRRRTELIAQRIQACEQAIGGVEQTTAANERVTQTARIIRLATRCRTLKPTSKRCAPNRRRAVNLAPTASSIGSSSSRRGGRLNGTGPGAADPGRGRRRTTPATVARQADLPGGAPAAASTL